MKKLFYPAIFQKEDEGFSIFFPDLEGCFTEGDDMDTAYEMAFDALGLYISYFEDNNKQVPRPSTPNQFNLEDNQFIVIIEFDMLAYYKKHNSKAVKKTLSIPSWLNDIAIEQNINFSQVLQEALTEKLQLKQ